MNNGFVFSLFVAVVIFFLGFTIEKGQKKIINVLLSSNN